MNSLDERFLPGDLVTRRATTSWALFAQIIVSRCSVTDRLEASDERAGVTVRRNFSAWPSPQTSVSRSLCGSAELVDVQREPVDDPEQS